MTSPLRLEPDVSSRLIAALQELAQARDLGGIMELVCRAARRLTGADGVTFVLREEGQCHHAEENAVSPGWKGRRFPLESSLGGQVMLHRRSALIENVADDPQVPAGAWWPAGVQSLVIVPVRERAPVAAICCYWARTHLITEEEPWLLRILAHSTSVAMENVESLSGLERRMRRRTHELEVANRELDRFAYSVSHDLQSPLSSILGYASMLADDHGASLPAEVRVYLQRIQEAGRRMAGMIKDIQKLSCLPDGPVERKQVDLSALAGDILARLAAADPARKVAVDIRSGGIAPGDAGQLRTALENLLGNAWKFTTRTAEARIGFGYSEGEGVREFFVRDNGAGFDEAQAGRLFSPFQRLHAAEDFGGSGMGLATVRRIVVKHGGEVRATGQTGRGATFYFTLPTS